MTPVAASALLGVLLVGTTYKVTLAGELWYPSDSKGGIGTRCSWWPDC